ncbi:Biotin carboxyl carrier protein of acetyl-CoA carboxylase [Moraxella lacunata]|uniref:Biotin carboxyl carrier protein of acetyl-CoA carboxylase n=1 Tax=Moraxella lacunata TaxID=477 RepID=A0A378QJ25_MORLA|nr:MULTISPECIES: acetyl-CoA carboxylase biotin carboxyl carrier protein [unclassified Moraxella]STY99343.1 Biotin carboxyl carrier protein of acetyl-CoA carboxylase [Moraxella lacunata]
MGILKNTQKPTSQSTKTQTATNATIDIAQIRELIELMEEKDLANLELGNDDSYVHLTRNVAVQTVAMPQMSAPASTAPTAPTPKTPSGKVETSPMVGVFYSAPSPNDPPFVKVGQKVEAGDQLGIIEAMKIMNPLEATQSGIIEEILVSNADVVQFGQPVIRYKA